MKHFVLGLLAHVDSGKTTLSENLLFKSGMIRKMGRVDNGDSFLDNNLIERERGITVFSKQATLELDDTVITLLDTPGHIDFSAEMERTLQVLDYGILIISASDGITGHTKTLYRLLRKYDIPFFIFVNKMDMPDCNKANILDNIKNSLTSIAVDFDDTENLYENVATSNEELMEKFLSGKDITDEEIADSIINNELVPVFWGSALKMSGMDELIEGLRRFTLNPEYSSDFSAICYKISRDDDGNRLTHLKITGGNLISKMKIDEFGKVNQIRLYSGAKYETKDELKAGRICAVTGLSGTYAGQTFGNIGEIPPMLTPVLNYTVTTEPKISDQILLPKLKELEEEIPELNVVYDEITKEIKAELMGEVQTEIIKRIILDRFGINISFVQGKILYRETVANTAIGIGHFEPLRHYAEAVLKIEPIRRGTGLVFDTECSEDVLAKNWQRLILTHLGEKMHRGVLTGAPLTDVKITIINGRASEKHTEGGDFRQATYRAVRNGLMYANNILLEPYYDFVLEIPETNIGKAMTDFEKMFCTINSPEINNGQASISGYGPVSLLQNYSGEVLIYTKGYGKLSLNYRGYDICHNQEEVIADMQYDPTSDIRNTPDSVFCANGAGFVVPWNEVRNHMHSEMDFEENKEHHKIKHPELREKLDISLGTEEIDDIIYKASNANANSKKNKWNLNKKKSYDIPTVKYKPVSKKEKYILVDGYNVIFAWKDLSELAGLNIDSARGKLLDIMCNYQGYVGINLIVVFDAYRIQGHGTEYLDYNNIHVVYTREAETADRYIEHFAHENGQKYDITVVTSDGLEQIIVRGEGCHLISSREFEKEVGLKNLDNMLQ